MARNPKLNQIIAVVQGKKTRAQKLLTTAHRGWHKDRIGGITRTYKPKDEDGEQLQPERRAVQLRVKDALSKVQGEMTEFMNAVATQEYGNRGAKGTIAVGDRTILKDVPVTALLFLEKQLIDLHTFVGKIPTLPTDRVWKWDENKNCYATETEETVKTQKVATTHVKFDPTEHQPGQADIINVDKTVGHWTTIHLSGAMPEMDRDDMLVRVEKLQDAVKVAREEANSAEVEQQDAFGKQVLGFVFGGELKRDE